MGSYIKENYVKDKVIIITGASAGFGRETAIKAAAMGGKVVLAARRGEVLKDITEQIRADGGDATYIKTDIRFKDQVRAMAKHAMDSYGRIDVLVNNAGTMPLSFFSDHEFAMDAWEECIDTAIKGTLFCTCAVYDQMIEQCQGQVINVSSILGNFAVNGGGVYNVSKVAVRYLADALRIEATGKIKVTTIKPTSVSATELGKTIVNIQGSMAGMYGKIFDAMGNSNPLANPDMSNRDSVRYTEPLPSDIADNIIYAINQPWGVNIGELTVRASGESMFV